jgi:alginate O-acetyltransferase complex protein AlgJ
MKTLIIAGTMKGGTTALYDFISSHSKVLAGSKKEIHYFSLYKHLGDEWYLNHFDFENNKDKEYIIDASPTYFDQVTSDIIPNHIKKFDKNVKIVVITRDPLSRAVSHYKHLHVINKIKELEGLSMNSFFSNSFSKSITRSSNIDYYLNLILSFSSYYRKMLIYKNVFQNNQLLFLSNEELKKDPYKTMKKVFSFMNLEYEDNSIFHEIRYSNKSNIDLLDKDIYMKLAELLYPDYDKFCENTGINNTKTEYQYKDILEIENDVMKGKDGWLFLYGGANEVHRYYTDQHFFNSKKMDEWKNLLLNRKSEMKKLDIEYLHVLAPEKISVYPEFLDSNFKTTSLNPISKIFSKYNDELNHFVVNPIPYFNKIKNEGNLLYWKTDTHWTFFGAVAAFQLILSKLNLELPPYFSQISSLSSKLQLDLGSKLATKPKELYTTVNFNKHAKRVYANELVKINESNIDNKIDFHVGCNVYFENSNQHAIQKSVIIFGDSFSEYRPHLLTGLFAESFKEVHFVWSTSIDYKYIKRIKPNIVISEIAERFMNQLPTDKFDLKNYLHNKLKTKK